MLCHKRIELGRDDGARDQKADCCTQNEHNHLGISLSLDLTNAGNRFGVLPTTNSAGLLVKLSGSDFAHQPFALDLTAEQSKGGVEIVSANLDREAPLAFEARLKVFTH